VQVDRGERKSDKHNGARASQSEGGALPEFVKDRSIDRLDIFRRDDFIELLSPLLVWALPQANRIILASERKPVKRSMELEKIDCPVVSSGAGSAPDFPALD
jgi:hypothetical protein